MLEENHLFSHNESSMNYKVSMAKAGDLKTEVFLCSFEPQLLLIYVALLFSVLLLDWVIVFSVSAVSVFLSRPGLYDSRKASMAASLGLYMLKPLSFCSQTTRVAVMLLTFISDLETFSMLRSSWIVSHKNIRVRSNYNSFIQLTFEEHVDIRGDIHVP